MSTTKLVPLLWLSCATLLSACSASSRPVSLGYPRVAATASDYSTMLSRWTRSTRTFKQLDTTLKVHATLVSPEFSSAFEARYAELFKLPAKRRAERRDRFETSWKKEISFFVAAATHASKYNDFDKEKSVWRLGLVSNREEEVETTTIERESRITPTTTELFPHVGVFHKVYRIRFPRAVDGGKDLLRRGTQALTLHIAGPLGHAEMVWRLR